MKMVREGQFVKSGMELFMLSDISKVWVFADIYEYELPWIRVGQKATIYMPFVGSEPIQSEISFIYPFVEPKTRTVKARFEIDNPDFLLKPDMYVNVRLNSDPVQNVISIPSEAVLHSGEVQTVFVALGNGKFEPRRVKTGLQSEAGDIEIKQGLLEGEQVVVSAQFMLDSESKLREAIQKMLEPQKAPLKEPSHSDDDLESLFEQEDQESLENLFD
jgi:Cu(I)/Ag(I) efflux system membrane fusion protein/cobalt-zinc-cadmium efflux system membrane fusion protein